MSRLTFCLSWRSRLSCQFIKSHVKWRWFNVDIDNWLVSNVLDLEIKCWRVEPDIVRCSRAWFVDALACQWVWSNYWLTCVCRISPPFKNCIVSMRQTNMLWLLSSQTCFDKQRNVSLFSIVIISFTCFYICDVIKQWFYYDVSIF